MQGNVRWRNSKFWNFAMLCKNQLAFKKLFNGCHMNSRSIFYFLVIKIVLHDRRYGFYGQRFYQLHENKRM